MRPPPKAPRELVGRHTTARETDAGEPRDLFLERAEYVSADYSRRLLAEFDWHRAAANLAPWRVRLYVRKEHATSPNGVAWRLASRATWSPSLRRALAEVREWMIRGARPIGPTRPPGRPRVRPLKV